MRCIGLVLVACAAMLGLGLSAESAAASKESEINELMKVSGIERQLAQLPELMKHQMAQQKQSVPPEVEKAMLKALLESYRPDVLLTTVRRLLDKIYDAEKMSASLEWLNGTISKRMTQLEINASTVEAQKARDAYAKSWATIPPSQRRVQMMMKYNDATQATVLAIRMIVASFDGVMRGVMPLMPEKKRIATEKMVILRAEMLQRSTQYLLKQNITAFMFTYREVSDEDMGRAIAFYRSDVGRWYQEMMMNGLLTAMSEAGVRFGQKMESIAKEAPKKA